MTKNLVKVLIIITYQECSDTLKECGKLVVLLVLFETEHWMGELTHTTLGS